jgi:membrane associated rhomboid family serine protease
MLTIYPLFTLLLALSLTAGLSFPSLKGTPAVFGSIFGHQNDIKNLRDIDIDRVGGGSRDSKFVLGGGRSWKSDYDRRRRGGGKRITGNGNGVQSIRIGNTRIPITATNIIIAINIFMYSITKGFFGFFESRYRLNGLMKINRAVSMGQTYRLFTALFCHGSPAHLAINSYSLYNMGPSAERMFGTGRYVLIYLATGVLANFMTFATGNSPFSLGSSGCTFGLIGAFACHFYRNRRILGPSAQAGLQSIKQTVLINLFYGASSPSIDNGAHIFGFLAGGACSYLIGPRLVPLREEFGRSRIVDKPIVPYRKFFRTFKEYIFGSV